MNLAHALERTARHHPDAVALSGRGVRGERSYEELAVRVRRLSSGFAELGVERGDRVALLTKNHAAFVETSFALYRLGASKVPLNSMLTPREHDLLVDDAGADVLVTETSFADHCGTMESSLRATVVVDGEDEALHESWDGNVRSYDSLLDADPTDRPADVSLDHPCAVMYTSGTTGRPKGVLHTHGTWLSTALGLRDALDQRAGEVTLHAAPLTHGSGFLVESTVLSAGTNHLEDGFAPDRFLGAVESRGVNTVFLAPTMVYKLLDEYDGDRDTSSLKNVYYAGSPMSAARLAEGMDRLGDVFVQSYGQMECPMLVTLLDHEDHRRALEGDGERLASAGREVDIAHVRIVDDDGRDVRPGEPGEVVVTGPHVTPGYLNLPEKTEAAFSDGWLRTGDIGRVDDEGYLYIMDRKKDMIITGGMNVYPREVEEVVIGHEAVSNAAVIGVPDDYWGEKVTAVVEPRPGADTDGETLAAEVEARCAESLAAYKKPKSVEIVDELPRSSYGKVLKTELREEYWEGEERRI
ncbi:AMP-binding protein [Haloprofundus sp. MHR1]|uniref:AMP-binding protein n=1 Tax=Haloprofundus sp. MHR1 TaxID=2572921 RepID=UPI0010BE9665|nr:AMP-binding protein [Haloprofundus sp. MHR1]QCJ47104.1 long-chain fatty acid--CoA ligase [Haloprofundus sp. MHR1]